MIKAGDVDLGIAVHHSINDEFDFVPMFPYERVLMAPLGHPILEDEITSLEQIARWPLVLMGPHTLTRTVLEEEMRRKGLTYDLALELDDLDMIKRYVATGIGISIGPRFAIDADDHKRLGVYSLMNLLPVEQTGILTLRGKSLSRPTRNFIEVTREIPGKTVYLTRTGIAARSLPSPLTGVVTPIICRAIQMVAWFTVTTFFPSRRSSSSTTSRERQAVPGRKTVSASWDAVRETKSTITLGSWLPMTPWCVRCCISGSPSARATWEARLLHYRPQPLVQKRLSIGTGHADYPGVQSPQSLQ